MIKWGWYALDFATHCSPDYPLASADRHVLIKEPPSTASRSDSDLRLLRDFGVSSVERSGSRLQKGCVSLQQIGVQLVIVPKSASGAKYL